MDPDIGEQELAAWAQALERSIEDHMVPGAAVAVVDKGSTHVLVAGLAGGRGTGAVSADTAFQIGSLAKLYVATLCGLVGLDGDSLDVAVSDLLPEGHWLDDDITIRHLLTHTSGLPGDVFTDTGRDDDALAVYVSLLHGVLKDVPGSSGRRYSYCNSGFAVLGRLLESISGVPYPKLLRTRLLEPLGTSATTLLPDTRGLRELTSGHRPGRSGAFESISPSGYPRSLGPIGGIAACAEDLAKFALLHLRDGQAPDGQPLVPRSWITEMARCSVPVPGGGRLSARGLGWAVYNWDGATVLGHDGEVRGQMASLRLSREHDLAVAVLTNCAPNGAFVVQDMENMVLQRWAIRPHSLPMHTRKVAEPWRYEGRFSNYGSLVAVRAAPDGALLMSCLDDGLPPEGPAVMLGATAEPGVFRTISLSRPADVVVFDDLAPDGRYQSIFDGSVAWRTA